MSGELVQYQVARVGPFLICGSIGFFRVNTCSPYVTVNKDLEKLPPLMYSMKMKICHDQGYYDIGVVKAMK